MSGGRDASRGFYLQALVSIFESIRTTSWRSILVEPSEDKVDIEITYLDGSVKVIQVKSTKNNFKPYKIKEVARSLIKASESAVEYELFLIGDLSPASKNQVDYQNEQLNINIKVGISKKVTINQMPLNVEKIQSKVKSGLNEYMINLGLEVSDNKLSLIHGNLIAESLLASTNGKVLLKEEFNDRLRTFVSILNNTEEVSPKIILSTEAINLLKRRKRYRNGGFLLITLFIIGIFVKVKRDGLSIVELVGLSVFWISIVSIFLFFKISDTKFRNKENKEIDEYKKNTNTALNNKLKLQVFDKVDYVSDVRKVYRVIELYNISGKKIDYIQGDLFFYQGSIRLHKQDFSIDNLKSNESVIVYNNYLVTEKSKRYWSHFSLIIVKSSMEDLKDKELYSSSIYRTYDTVLNSRYIPVLYYESTWAMEKLDLLYSSTIFYFNSRTLKGFLIVAMNLLLLSSVILFGLIGIYFSTYNVYLLFQ